MCPRWGFSPDAGRDRPAGLPGGHAAPSAWIVSLDRGARIKDVRRELPDLLVFLDEIGWNGQLWQLRREHPVVAARFQVLGVQAVAHLPPTETHPPGYLLLPESWGRWGEDDIEEPSFANAYLAGDNREVITLRRQLRQAQADERHVFLFIGHEHTEGWPLMKEPGEGDNMALPTMTPTPRADRRTMADWLVELQPSHRLASTQRVD